MVFTNRSVAVVVTGALIIGWMGSSLTQRIAPAQSAGAVGGGVRPVGSSTPIAHQAERLRQHMTQPPQPSRGRNPFVYGPRQPVRSASYRDRETAPVIVPPMPIAPPPPPLPIFKLSGIASNVEGTDTVLTAILNDNGALVFAKAGDKLSNGYSVVSVEERAVTLVDAQGIALTIRLP